VQPAGPLNDTYLHRITNGPHCRPYIVYPFTAESGWTFNTSFHARDHVATIYLTPFERDGGRLLRERLGPFVLIEPWSKHANLRWPLDAWHVLVAARPDLTFVQHLHAGSGDCIVRGAEYIYTTTFRDACGVLAAASLYVRGESGMCHAAAALGIPQVTIWGGCMDWDVLGRYPKQIGVGVTEPCCGQWLPCTHCATIMARIAVRTVSDAIDQGCTIAHGVR
jgi:ADP-heptose:LPS heptosyltransferase